MSALRDAIAAWQALSPEDRRHLTAYLQDDTQEGTLALAKIVRRDREGYRGEREDMARRVRVNEAALALLEAAMQTALPETPAIERLKAAARRRSGAVERYEPEATKS